MKRTPLPRSFTLTRAARLLGLTYEGVRKLILRGRLTESWETNGIRTITTESLNEELDHRGLPPAQ